MMKNKGKIELLLLHFISKQGGQPGFSLAKRIGDFNGKVPSTGTYYPLLSKLKEAGYIKDKNVITPEGVKYLDSLKEAFYFELDYLIKVSDLVNDKPEHLKRIQ